ncbi:MAG: TolC family protein, partial [Candidatus Dadabacteria bacterium]
KTAAFVVVLTILLSLSPTASGEEKISLKEALNIAFEKNQDLLRLEKEYKALEQKAVNLGTLPDPVISATYLPKSTETRVGPQKYALSFTQKMPWFGTLSLKEKKTYLEAKALYYRYLTEKNNTAALVVKNYLELGFIEKAIAIYQAEKRLLKSWEKVVLNRYSTSTASQAPLLRIQVELTVLYDLIKTLQDKRKPVKASLLALLHLKENKNFSAVEALSTPFSPSPFIKKREAFAKIEQSPIIERAKIKLLAKDAGVKLAKKALYPSLGLSFKYIGVGDRDEAGTESGKDAALATLSFSIPIFYLKGKKAKIKSAKEEKSAAKNNLRWTEDKVRQRLEELFFLLNDSKRKVTLYKDSLIPKAQEALDTYYSSFQTGEATFLDLLDSERALLRLKIKYWQALKRKKTAKANILALLGKLTN